MVMPKASSHRVCTFLVFGLDAHCGIMYTCGFCDSLAKAPSTWLKQYGTSSVFGCCYVAVSHNLPAVWLFGIMCTVIKMTGGTNRQLWSRLSTKWRLRLLNTRDNLLTHTDWHVVSGASTNTHFRANPLVALTHDLRVRTGIDYAAQK